MRIGAQFIRDRRRAARRIVQAQHFAPRARPERDAVGAGCRLQGRQQVLRIDDPVRIRLSLRIAAQLAGKTHQLLVPALAAPHPQEAVRKNAAFEESFEFVFDKLRQARCAPCFDLREERFEMFLYQAIQRGLLGAAAFVVPRVCGGCAQERGTHEGVGGIWKDVII